MADGVAVERRTAEVIMGGSLGEVVVSGGSAVLSILALAGIMPMTMVAIATVGIGVSLLFIGGAIASRYSELIQQVTKGRVEIAEVSSGTTAESLGGAAGIALGVLALLGLIPMILIAAAVIVFGGAIIMGAGITERLSILEMEHAEENQLARRVMREIVNATSGVQVLAGLAAITLGILSLTGIRSQMMNNVGILVLSVSLLMSGTALGSRIFSMFRRS